MLQVCVMLDNNNNNLIKIITAIDNLGEMSNIRKLTLKNIILLLKKISLYFQLLNLVFFRIYYIFIVLIHI